MKSSQVHTDVLAALLQEGDTSAFRTLFDRFRPSVYAYCARMLGDRDEAEDAAQETFIHALRDASGLRSPERFRGWLFGIARQEGEAFDLVPLPAKRDARRIEDRIGEFVQKSVRLEPVAVPEHPARSLAPAAADRPWPWQTSRRYAR